MRLFADASMDVSTPLLARALSLAEQGRGSTSPNPMVGCVIAHGDEVVGEGFHAKAGEPHAEVMALRAAGARAQGATVYVTLEPCNHFGKTPPCSEALLAAGVRSVVIGMQDPNRDVSGGGAARLREQGVEVAFADDPMPFRELNEAWLKRMETGLPWVRVKLASSLDGHASASKGQRTGITGAGGRGLTQRLRAASSAVCVGASTLRIDDPVLTVRDSQGLPRARQPKRIVLSRTTVPSSGSALLRDVHAGVLVLIGDEVADLAAETLDREGVTVLGYDASKGLRAAISAIGKAGIDDVLIEAGPGMLAVLWREELMDELFVVQAGGMLGDAAPPLYTGRAEVEDGRLMPRMRAVEAGMAGDDAVVVWRPFVDGATVSRKE